MDKDKNLLIMTVGLPRSGKSTWAKYQGSPIVNPDSIRLALHGQPFIPEAEGVVWETAYLMTKALFIAGHHTVIIDATNITAHLRDVWEKKFPDCEYVYRFFNADKETCIDRAITDGKEYLVPVIERMDAIQDYR